MYPNMEHAGAPPAAKGGGDGPEEGARRCIVDEDLLCPPSRYDCTRPCPYTGWERRMAAQSG
jgi:hypothetical protein